MGRSELLLGELERLFGLEAMMALSEQLLGLDPSDVGGTGGKGAFARALVEKCAAEHRLAALADAIVLTAPAANTQLNERQQPTSEGELASGTVLAGFRVLKRLGRGPLASVYLAERKTPGNGKAERAAIKVFDELVSRDEEVLWRFLTSVRAARDIRVSGMAQVYDAGLLDDGRAWVATEFIAGQSLAGRLGRTGAIHFHEVQPVARTLLHALEALHARGLLHGNLKVDNIFVVRQHVEGQAKTKPFGVLVDVCQGRLLETSLPRTDQLVHLVGVPQTVAPERVLGDAPSIASEVYALACLLYHALAGRPPFTGQTPVDVLAAQLRQQPEPPSAYAPRHWVPAQLDEALLRALHKDPTRRYASAADFADALETVARSLIPPAEQPTLDLETLLRTVAALQENPSDDGIAERLETLVEPTRDWQQAVDAFFEAAATSQDLNASKSLLFRAGRILHQEMRDPQAAESAYRKVLENDPNDAHAQTAIEELRRALGDHEGLVELLLARLESETVTGARAAILREVAGLCEEQLASRDDARSAWARVLLEDPDDERAARAVERLARSPEHWEEVLSTLEQGANACESPRVQLALYVWLGRWWSEHMGRTDVAVNFLSQALRLDPAHEPALDALTDLYRRSQSWGELAQVLLHRADAAASAARSRDLNAEAALIYLDYLGDPGTAGQMLAEVIEEDPAHPTASQALEKMLSDAQDWDGLATLLEARAAELRGEARCEALCQLAQLYEECLDEEDEAERKYVAAHSLNEHYMPALKGLEHIYTKRENYPALLDILAHQLNQSATPSQRIALLSRMGEILEEKVGDVAAATERFEQLIELSPGHDAANAALARLYRHAQRFDELAQTLDRHAKSVEDTEQKAQLLMQAARVLMADLGSPERASFMCERVLGLVPEHAEALELTARIRALGGDALAAVDAVEVMADTESDPIKKAELWVRAGKYLEEAEDLDGAIERYRAALALDSHSASATEALRDVYARRGDAHGEAELLLRQIEHCEDEGERAHKFIELGKLRKERIRDIALAANAFEKAALLAPENMEAALELGLIALLRKQWQTATERLSPLLEHSTELRQDRALQLCLGLGDAERELDHPDAAERAYLHGKSLAPHHPDVLQRLSQLAQDAGNHQDAAALYEELLEHKGSKLSPGEQADLLLKLGRMRHAAGDNDAAVEALRRAKALAPEDTNVLRALGLVQRDLSSWNELTRTLRRHIELCTDERERFALWVEAGDVFANQLRDRHRASKAYVSALEIDADDRNLLAKLMSVYSEGKDWGKLVEVLERMASVVQEPSVQAKYLTTSASLVQVELKDPKRAMGLYRRALDADGTYASAFDGLRQCLEHSGDWAGVVNATRQYIDAVRDTLPAERLAELWDHLGHVLQQRLERIDEAVHAFRQAHTHAPDDRGRLERLVEIYERHPNRYAEEAQEAHAFLLRQNPYRAESYQSLRKLYTQVERPDEAWCLCQALRALKVAEPEETEFFRQYRQPAAVTATEFATDEVWRQHIVHPDQDPLLTAIFAMVTPAAIARNSQDLRAFGTDKRQRVDLEQAEHMMPRMLGYAGTVMLLPSPAVYYRPKDNGGLSFLYTDPPSIGVGVGALAEAPDQAVAFIAGRHLSYFRAGHYMRQLVPTGSGLRSWLLAALRFSNPRFPVPQTLQSQVEQNHAAIQRSLTPPQQQSLTSMGEQLLRYTPELDMKRWAAAVDLTADRVGFILANSLDAAIAVVRASPGDSSYAPERDRVKELYLYGVSTKYFALRRALGIQIG